METIFSTLIFGLLGLAAVLGFVALCLLFARDVLRQVGELDLSEVRWGFCIKQSALGFFVAFFAAPNVGFVGAFIVGCLTPITVAVAWNMFERAAQPRQQAVRIKH